jgi:hypothetical protein
MLGKILILLVLLVTGIVACDHLPDNGESSCDGCGEARPTPLIPILACLAAVAPLIPQVSHVMGNSVTRPPVSLYHSQAAGLPTVPSVAVTHADIARIWESGEKQRQFQLLPFQLQVYAPPFYPVHLIPHFPQCLEKLVLGGAKLMVGAPTGSGKSLTFLFLPTLLCALEPPPNDLPENLPKVIVCMPFKSLLKSTCKAAAAFGFECAFDGEEQLDPKVKRFALAPR